MAFQIVHGIYGPIRLELGTRKSVSAVVRVSQIIPNAHLGSILEILDEDVGVQGQKNQYTKEKVQGLPGVERFVMEHHQNLHYILADMERAAANTWGETSHWCWNGVKMIRFVDREAGCSLQRSKLEKLWNLPQSKHCTDCTVYVRLFTHQWRLIH